MFLVWVRSIASRRYFVESIAQSMNPSIYPSIDQIISQSMYDDTWYAVVAEAVQCTIAMMDMMVCCCDSDLSRE